MKLNPQQAPLYVSIIIHALPSPRTLHLFTCLPAISLAVANILFLYVKWMESLCELMSDLGAGVCPSSGASPPHGWC